MVLNSLPLSICGESAVELKVLHAELSLDDKEKDHCISAVKF